MKRRDFIKLSSAGTIGAVAIESKAGIISYNLWDNKPDQAKFIWYSKDSTGRNLNACFRKSFTINGMVQSAEICLFADTAYQLYVNGEFVQFGPVRFDPRFPQYDKHDISRYLKGGKNTIAVSVNYYGMKVFKAIPTSGGFIAWGNIKTADKTISLETKNGSWKTIVNKAYSRFASKISFALNARDIYDQSLEETGWKTADFDDSHWAGAVELSNQKIWGTPAERYMPFLSGELLTIPGVKHILPLEMNEDIYSFTVPVPDFRDDNSNSKDVYIPFSTWIFSPVDQTITVGSYFGEKWINGELLPRGLESEIKNMRINQLWDLKKGWNYFFGKVGTYSDAIDIYYAFPKGRCIIVAADKKPDSEYSFRYISILNKESFDKLLGKKTLPYLPEEELKEAGGWKLQKRTDTAWSPGYDTGWEDYGEQVEELKANQINSHVFSKSVYPNGFSILFNLEYIRLAIPEISMEGTKDCIIDLTYSEHLSPDNQHLKQSFNYNGADRVYCSKDKVEWTCTNPRGMRYFMITVRNIQSDIKINKIILRSAQYPVKWNGKMECSDLLLNSVWQMCALTQACNMTDAYVDCDGREQGMYVRDTIIQYHNNLAVFGDHALMKRCIELYGQSPDSTGKFRAVYPNTGDYTIADFSLNMLEGYLVYYQNTGDKDSIGRDWNAIMKNMEWFNQLADERDDLLLDAEWDTKRGIKAHYGGFHGDLDIKKGYMDINGIHCTFSCNYIIALQCAETLAVALGKTADAASFRKRIDVLKKSILKFWNPAKKAYADNLNFTTHSHHASIFAVRAGVATPEQIEPIKKHVAFELRSIFVNGYDPSDGNLTSPSYAFYIFDGLYKLGLAKTAEDMMRIGWGWFLFMGCKTAPEYFTLRSSLCHAWSASPAYYLSKYMLGINFPKLPDMDYVEINIQTHYASFAEGKWPHPKGLIEVKWHNDDSGKRVFDYAKAPAGVTVKIIG